MRDNRARTRAIRQRMSETGETYTQAIHALNPKAKRHAPVRQLDVLRSIVAKLVQADRNYESLLEVERNRLETEGYRLIGGGQTDGELWEILDGRTGEPITDGDGGIAGYGAAIQQLDPDGMWFHIDQIKTEDEDPFDLVIDRLTEQGTPRSLIEAIGDWAMLVSDEELESYLGYSINPAAQP